MATKPHLIDTLPSSTLQTFIGAFRQVDLTSPKSIYDTYVQVGGKFKWDDAVTPLSSLQSIGLTLVLYVIISYTISFILGTKTPKEMEEERKNPTFFQKVLKWVAFLHNLNMTVISLVCFFGLLFEVAKIGLKDGFYSLLCDPEHKYNVGYIPFWTYMYYMSKYVELFDTFLLVIRRSRLRFIHTYHHVTTMSICYYGLYTGGTGQWIPIALNTFVHIIMYYYYMKVTLGFDVWWKMYLTDIQLVQFILDAATFTAYCYVEMFWERPRGNTCTGSFYGSLTGDIVVISFFFLFFKLRQENARALAKKKAAKEQLAKKEE
ncbi:hypothetical protein C9374_000165 [Naegleria lovaniensis]|uniref:Elongation of fatty acids protein n=1 Tax=Naegleria lovaniensis TaxID=51637 RepID=A0AA88GUN1_NAELO|nr:uncharacterized protein C9374_000165 [Naegleria lovaniensis]KAG2388726.1 hypothetical protein C9374_000165 [Naegleria lovaniensis]